jgi:modification methylase scrFIB
MIRVFEAFAGIGTQSMALKNINLSYEIVATSEIDINAIKAYTYIHHDDKINTNFIYPSLTKIKEFLFKKNIGNFSLAQLNSLSSEELKKLYKFCILNKNIGDISKIDLKEIPEHDLFTYSFPCQDLSTFGTRLGCEENSGTRSSLLWSCKKIIEYIKPKYLLLENVKNLIGGTHIKSFKKWILFLEENGYNNYFEILDSADYGIPQRRKRVFLISILKDTDNQVSFKFPEKIPLAPLEKFIDKNIEFFPYTSHLDKADINLASTNIKFLDDRDWNFNGVIISNICSTQRAGRSGIKLCKIDKNHTLLARNITPNESWRLMGISDEYFNKVKLGNFSNGVLFKLAGNAIVVNVLEKIFKSIFKNRKEYKL